MYYVLYLYFYLAFFSFLHYYHDGLCRPFLLNVLERLPVAVYFPIDCLLQWYPNFIRDPLLNEKQFRAPPNIMMYISVTVVIYPPAIGYHILDQKAFICHY